MTLAAQQNNFAYNIYHLICYHRLTDNHQNNKYYKAVFTITHLPFSKYFILNNVTGDTLINTKVLPDNAYIIKYVFRTFVKILFL